MMRMPFTSKIPNIWNIVSFPGNSVFCAVKYNLTSLFNNLIFKVEVKERYDFASVFLQPHIIS